MDICVLKMSRVPHTLLWLKNEVLIYTIKYTVVIDYIKIPFSADLLKCLEMRLSEVFLPHREQ